MAKSSISRRNYVLCGVSKRTSSRKALINLHYIVVTLIDENLFEANIVETVFDDKYEEKLLLLTISTDILH